MLLTKISKRLPAAGKEAIKADIAPITRTTGHSPGHSEQGIDQPATCPAT